MATTAAEKNQRIIMVPVATNDFGKLNEIAEALMVVKNPRRAKQISEMRTKLLHDHNSGSFLLDYYCVHCFKINNNA